MRINVDIEPDLLARIRQRADEEGVSFTEALSGAIARGLTAPMKAERKPYVLPKVKLGIGQVLDTRHLNRFFAEEDTVEFVRKFYPDQLSAFEDSTRPQA